MRKYPLSLIEVMIVILLISLIGGVISYNVKGSLHKGKQFKTAQAKEQLENALNICLQESNKTPQQILDKKEEALQESGIVKNPKKILTDGWGREFDVIYDEKNGCFIVNDPLATDSVQ